MKTLPLRQIEYPQHESLRVRFCIPLEWREDYADPEVALFYLPVTHADGPSPIEGSLFVFAYTGDTALAAPIEQHSRTLPDGGFLSYTKEYQALETHNAVVHRWTRHHIAGSRRTSFVFAFTAVADFFDTPEDPYYETVALLEREIEAATVIGSSPPPRRHGR